MTKCLPSNDPMQCGNLVLNPSSILSHPPAVQSQEIEQVTDQTEDDPLIRDRTSTATTPSRPPSIQTVKRRRLASETAEKQMTVAFGQLNNVLSQKQNENRPPYKEDDCDIYAKLLAIKLRELPTDERNIMMY
ncbi:hypothetical protein ACJJTC_006428 [Scirpophaga incertulas]